MPQKINYEDNGQDPLKRKLKNLIKKKSDENLALKKLLDGLNKKGLSKNQENN